MKLFSLEIARAVKQPSIPQHGKSALKSSQQTEKHHSMTDERVSNLMTLFELLDLKGF